MEKTDIPSDRVDTLGYGQSSEIHQILIVQRSAGNPAQLSAYLRIATEMLSNPRGGRVVRSV